MLREIKYVQMLMRKRESRGPDVEMLLFMPIAVAIEDKRTAKTALDEIEQAERYAESGMYDAVLIRLESPGGGSWLKRLLDRARCKGLGVVLGNGAYSPLAGSERVLSRAQLKMRADPLRLYKKGREMGIIARSVERAEELLEDLSRFRGFFSGEGCGTA